MKLVKGEQKNKNREDRNQTIDLTEIQPYEKIHVNSLNTPIKKQELTKWIKMQDTTISCLRRQFHI